MNIGLANHELAGDSQVADLTYCGTNRWLEDIEHYLCLLNEQEAIYEAQTRLVEDIGDLKRGSYAHHLAVAKIKQLNETLMDLDQRASCLSAEMDKTETKVLTYEPQDSEQAELMLDFVSTVLSIDHKIDSSYVADIIENCTKRQSAAA